MLKSHKLTLDLFEDFVEEHGGCITLATDHLIVVLVLLESLLKHNDPLLQLMVQSLKALLLILTLLANPHELIEEDGALFLSLDLVSVILTQFGLQKVSHLGQL